jgi:hypothetical protein
LSALSEHCGDVATITVLTTSVADKPSESVTLYETVYVPAVVVLTVLKVTILDVMSPSSISAAVAPASVYVEPTVSVVGVVPRSVITGAVFTALIVAELLQEIISLSVPETIVVEAVFVPADEYDFVVVVADPERPSVPDHVKVYGLTPPTGTAVQVTVSPVSAVVRSTEHVPARGVLLSSVSVSLEHPISSG